MSISTYIENLMESITKPGAEFKYSVGGVENTYLMVDVAGEIQLNVVGVGQTVTRWRGKNDTATAHAEIEKIVAKVGEARFNDVVNRGKAKTAMASSDTGWESYSEYNTSRGNHAFTVYKRTRNGKIEFKNEGKKWIDIHNAKTIEDANKMIAKENSFYKLKHVSGYNHKV